MNVSRLIQTLGKPGAVALIVALVLALVFCSWQHIAVPSLVEYLVEALAAGSLYGQTPPHLRASSSSAAGLVENGDAEGSSS